MTARKLLALAVPLLSLIAAGMTLALILTPQSLDDLGQPSAKAITAGVLAVVAGIGAAVRYLDDRKLHISKIAWLLGFNEVSAFTHAFKRWTGMTPSQVQTTGAYLKCHRLRKPR